MVSDFFFFTLILGFSTYSFSLFVSGSEIVVFRSNLALWFTILFKLCSFNSKLLNKVLNII